VKLNINSLPLRRVRPAVTLRFVNPARAPTEPIVFVLSDEVRAALTTYRARS
jgi:hypothetical protein